MKKTIILSLISCIMTNAAEYPITVIDLQDIEHTVSRETSEINNDSFCVSVISFHEAENPSDEPSRTTDRNDLNQ